MNIIETLLAAVAAGVCLFSAILIHLQMKHTCCKFFKIYLCLKALGSVLVWLMVHPATSYKAIWLGFYISTSFLLAPALWLFSLEATSNKTPSIRRMRIIEWGLLFTGVILTVPVMLSAHEGILMVDPLRETKSIFESIIHETLLAAIFLFLLQAPWYIIRCLKIIKRHWQYGNSHFSNIDDMQITQLKGLVWLMIGTWLFGLARTIRAFTVDGSTILDPLFTCGEAVMLIWALYFILKRYFLINEKSTSLQLPIRDSLEEISVEKEAKLNTEQSAAAQDMSSNKDKHFSQPKYAKSSLDATTRQRVQNKLKEAMEIDFLFTQPNLRLRDLCDHIKENPHYVSQVINETLNMTFYELINQHRIKAAQQRLLTRKDESILEIALHVGFNSKGPFNTAFKRYTGMTPGAFRKSKN